MSAQASGAGSTTTSKPCASGPITSGSLSCKRIFASTPTHLRPTKLTPLSPSEFGNIFIYLIIYTTLLLRLRTNHYHPAAAAHIRAISNLMVVYPLVYVVCTIPLASARMDAMTGHAPSLERLCLAGAIITSNGWLDVLLYTLTRRIMIFSDAPPPDDAGIDSFAAFWAVGDSTTRFGAECTVEAMHTLPRPRHRQRQARARARALGEGDSADDLCALGSRDIKLVMTTQVVSEPALPEDYEEMQGEARKARPRSPLSQWSGESVKGG
jgi:hypothetical protein